MLVKQVQIFDPFGMIERAGLTQYQKYRVGWNPLDRIRDYASAQAVMKMQLEKDGHGVASDATHQFFGDASQTLAAGFALAAARLHGSMVDVRRWVAAAASNTHHIDVLGEVGSALHNDPEAWAEFQQAWVTFGETAGNSAEGMRKSAWATLQNMMKPYSLPQVLEWSDPKQHRMIDMAETVRTTGSTLYVIAPSSQEDVTNSGNLLSGFLGQMLAAARDEALTWGEEGLPEPMLFLADEYTTLGGIYGFVQEVATARKYNIAFRIVTQTRHALETLYSQPEWLAIDTNLHATLSYPQAMGVKEREIVAESFGKRTVKHISVSKGKGKDGGSGENVSDSRIDRVEPAQLLNLPRNRFVLSYSGGTSLVLRQHRCVTDRNDSRDWFVDPVMEARLRTGSAWKVKKQVRFAQTRKRLAGAQQLVRRMVPSAAR
jgi:type IV secretory pathway TraG/TraD family ATPase VirD4